MSVRRRHWITSKGARRSAWVVDYFNSKGKRKLKTFDSKDMAKLFWASRLFAREKQKGRSLSTEVIPTL